MLYHNININKISPGSEGRKPSVPYLSVSLFRMVYNPHHPHHPQSNLNDNKVQMNVHRTLYKGVTEILAKMYFCPNNALETQDNMTNAEAPKELFSKVIQLNMESAFHTVMILKFVKDLHSSFSIFFFYSKLIYDK